MLEVVLVSIPGLCLVQVHYATRYDLAGMEQDLLQGKNK